MCSYQTRKAFVVAKQGHSIQLDKFDKLDTLDEKLQLIYEWVETGHINATQFKQLVRDTIVNDIVKDAGLYDRTLDLK